MNHRTSFATLILAAMFVFAACSTANEPAAPQATAAPQARLITQPTATPAGPAPTIAAPEQTSLPGRLLFVKNGDIWQWRGTAGTQLTHKGNLFQPAWSPNGRWIACTEREESLSNIVVMTADGTDQINITNASTDLPLHSLERIRETTWAMYPAFSPDSRSVIFSAQAAPPFGEPAVEYNLSLYSAPLAADARKQQLYASNEGNVGRVLYAPDNNIVFDFSPRALNKGAQIRRFNPETEAEDALAGMPEQSYDPAYSPDGRWLAFSMRHETGTDVFARPASGGTLTRLSTLNTARAPVFSPDGSMLAWLAIAAGGQHFDLWVAPVAAAADGMRIGTPQQLTHDVGIDADSGIAWGK